MPDRPPFSHWNQRTALAVVMAMLFLAPLCGWALRKIELRNEVENWLPSDDPHAKVLQWYHEHFRKSERVLLSWNSASLSDERIPRLAVALRGTADRHGIRRHGVPHVDAVVTPHDVLARMEEHGVPREEGLRRLSGVLIGRGAVDDSVASVAVIVTLSPAGSADMQGAVAAIRAAALAVGVPDSELHLAGGPVAGSALNQAVKSVAWNDAAPASRPDQRSLLLTTFLVGAILAFAMLRSIRLAVYVLAISVFTTVAAVAVVPVAGDSMNMVLVVMPALLLVLTISGSVHVANYWRHAALDDASTAGPNAIRAAFLPCLLASGTTAIGLWTLAASPLAPIRDFGIYAGLGCVLSFGTAVFGVTALLQLWPVRVKGDADSQSIVWRSLADWLHKRRWLVMGASAVVFAVSVAGLKWFRTETRVICYFPDHTRVVQDYRFFEGRITGVVPIELLVRFDSEAQGRLNFLERLELVRAVTEGVRKHPEVSGALSLADFQTPTAVPDPDAPFLEKARYHKKSQMMRERLVGIAGTGDRNSALVAAGSVENVERPLRGPGSARRTSLGIPRAGPATRSGGSPPMSTSWGTSTTTV